MELAARCHIEVHALLIGQTGHGPAEKRLGGIGHPLPPGLDRRPAGLTEVELVVDEEGRAELGRQVEQVDIAHPEMPVGVDGGRPGQQLPLHGGTGHFLVRRHGIAGYGSHRRGRDARTGRQTTLVPCSCPRSSADRAPASGAGGAGSSPAGGAIILAGQRPLFGSSRRCRIPLPITVGNQTEVTGKTVAAWLDSNLNAGTLQQMCETVWTNRMDCRVNPAARVPDAGSMPWRGAAPLECAARQRARRAISPGRSERSPILGDRVR